MNSVLHVNLPSMALNATYFFADVLRSAQYFFILTLTARFCAAVIFDRLRLGAIVSATSRAAVPMAR
ncbi:MAG TPA: hypothetical protein VN654_06675 [Vicinamibacterales bacterium]|nr:hypothetical protein [Vicinamibacterales bacterium]